MNFYTQNEKPSLYEFYFRFKTKVIGDLPDLSWLIVGTLGISTL